MWKRISKPVGAIVLALATAGSYVFPIPPQVLQKWWPLIFFVLFCFYIGWYILEQDKRIGELEKAKPKIEVKSKVYDKCAKLEIMNNGGEATFTAKARVIKGTAQPELYSMCWESSPDNPNCPINHGDTEPIIVAEIAPESAKTDDVFTAIYRGGIALYKMGRRRIGVTTIETIREYENKERYPTMYKDISTQADKCVVEVVITSAPPPLEDYDVKYYSIEINHEHGHKLVLTQLSEAEIGKEGSQT
jgi:hypothetical protein